MYLTPAVKKTNWTFYNHSLQQLIDLYLCVRTQTPLEIVGIRFCVSMNSNRKHGNNNDNKKPKSIFSKFLHAFLSMHLHALMYKYASRLETGVTALSTAKCNKRADTLIESLNWKS